MMPVLKVSSATVRAVAIAVGITGILFLPVAEVGSGFLLGNLHPSLEEPFVFSGRWALDIACLAAVGLALTAWSLAARRTRFAAILLVVAITLPLLGRAWLLHVDSIVSYPTGHFSN
jgi:hypothetical protein